MTRIIAPVEFIINILDAPSGFDFDELYMLFDYFYIETELKNEFDIKATVHSHETLGCYPLEGEGDIPTYLVLVEFVLDVPDSFDYDDLFLNFDYDHLLLAIRNLFGIEATIETHETQVPYEPEED